MHHTTTMILHIDHRKLHVQIGRGNNGSKIVFAGADAGASELWQTAPNPLGQDLRRQFIATACRACKGGWAIVPPHAFPLLEEITVR